MAPHRQSPQCPRKMQQEQLEPTAGLQQHQQEVATVTRTVTQKLLTVAAALQCTAAPLQEPPRAPHRQSPRCPRKMQKEQQALRVGLQQRHPQVAAKSTVTQLLMLVAVALQEPPPAHRRHNPRCPRCPHLSFRCHQSLLPCPPCRPFCARLPGTPLRSAPVERVIAFLNFLRGTRQVKSSQVKSSIDLNFVNVIPRFIFSDISPLSCRLLPYHVHLPFLDPFLGLSGLSPWSRGQLRVHLKRARADLGRLAGYDARRGRGERVRAAAHRRLLEELHRRLE